MYRFKIEYRDTENKRTKRMTVRACNVVEALKLFAVKKPDCFAFSCDELPQY
jgi:hypothetical protein